MWPPPLLRDSSTRVQTPTIPAVCVCLCVCVCVCVRARVCVTSSRLSNKSVAGVHQFIVSARFVVDACSAEWHHHAVHRTTSSSCGQFRIRRLIDRSRCAARRPLDSHVRLLGWISGTSTVHSVRVSRRCTDDRGSHLQFLEQRCHPFCSCVVVMSLRCNVLLCLLFWQRTRKTNIWLKLKRLPVVQNVSRSYGLTKRLVEWKIMQMISMTVCREKMALSFGIVGNLNLNLERTVFKLMVVLTTGKLLINSLTISAKHTLVTMPAVQQTCTLIHVN